MDNDAIIETYLRDWCYSEVEEALKVARADEMAKVLAPYDVESIEELIRNVKTKMVNDAEKLLEKTAPDKVAEIKCDDGEIRNRPLIDFAKVYEILEQMIGDKE